MEQIGLKYIVFFILIVSPGLMFRRFYFKGEFSKQFNSKNWTSFILWSSTVGMFIQFSSFLLFRTILKSLDVQEFMRSKFNVSCVDDVMTHGKELYMYFQNFDFGMMSEEWGYVVVVIIYYCIVLFVAFIIAQFSYAIVRTFNLDRRFSVFRFQNYWNYYFRGEINSFSEFKFLNKGKYIHTMADVLTQTSSGETKLYKGVLSQYTIESKTNKLETLYLSKVFRWRYSKSKEKMEQVNVPGDCMIIPYSSVLNINLEYVREPKKKYKIDPDYIFIPILILMILYVLFSDNNIFYSEKYLLITILLKIYYIFCSLVSVIYAYISLEALKDIGSIIKFRYKQNLEKGVNSNDFKKYVYKKANNSLAFIYLSIFIFLLYKIHLIFS